MSKEVKIDLSSLVNPGKTDWISGRTFGQKEAEKNNLIELIDDGKIITLLIDKEKVKAINDSFIKGFFSEVFKKLKTREQVSSQFKIESDPYFINLFEKNWTVLEALYAPSTR